MKYMLTITTSFLFFLLATPYIFAQDAGIQKKNGFSILIPKGWIEIPRDIIDADEKETANLAPNVPAQLYDYDYGFQLDKSTNWFELPYIFVKINNLGRISESQLEKLARYSVQESTKYKDDLNSIATDFQVEEIVYDKQNKIIWILTTVNRVDIGPVFSLHGMFATEKGFIQIVGNSLKNDYSKYEPIFRSIILSVTPDPSLVYKPKWSDSLPYYISGIDWVDALKYGFYAAIVVAIGGLLRSRKKGFL